MQAPVRDAAACKSIQPPQEGTVRGAMEILRNMG